MKTNNYKSECCNAPVKLENGEEGERYVLNAGSPAILLTIKR
jgi:hypothetical protein